MLTEKQKHTLTKNNEESRAITRESIRGALFLLLKGKSYQDISITEIIKKSGVSRSAFYRNYKSKDEVLFDAMDSLFKSMIQSLEQNLETNLKIIYTMVKEHHSTLKILVDAGLDYHILSIFNTHISYGTNRYETYIWNGFLYNIIVEWIKNPCEGTAEEVIPEIMDIFFHISDVILSNNGTFTNPISYRE